MSEPTALRLRAPVLLPCDPACSVVRDAVCDIRADGRLGYVGPAGAAPESAAPVRWCSGVLLPGLVNAHAHTPMTLLRGMGGDLPLLRWLHEVIWPAEAKLTGADCRAGMALGVLEMLRGGVTTSVEMYFHVTELADAVREAGARAILGAPLMALPGMDWRRMLADIEALIDTGGLRPDDRVEFGYGAHSAYTLPPAALPEIAASARARDALLQVHVAESADEDAEQRAAYGSVPAMLSTLDFFGGRVLAAHGVHLSDTDIALLAASGVAVAHCPGSNAKLASGIARLVDLRAAGVLVGLGTDGPSSNDDLDLWEEMRLAAMLARLSTRDATAVRAAEVLLLATREGAAAIGRPDIGALEPGRHADVVHLDAEDAAFPGGLDAPDEQLLANVVWASGTRLVRDVWVGGEQVVEAHETTRVDRAKVLADARAVTARLR